MIELRESKEVVLLAGVSQSDHDDTSQSLDELDELVSTAGAMVAGRVVQNREQAHPGTYLGKGKLEEVRELAGQLGAVGIVCDDELSPAQIRNLEDILELKVMDRTQVILDIFASRAVTREGKLQVELAQLRYRAARLTGLRSSLSRLGGGIGTRGPGEKKLETDRRLIHERIGQLKAELRDVERHREITRKQRKRNHVPVAAITGYTNAGKSTLLSRLTGADVPEENMLFATLDPATRILTLAGKEQILLTDTVGFIRRLPHHLIEAFRSTLEEVTCADVIIHVADCTSPQMELQMHVVYETLAHLGAAGQPVITVFNKTDLLENPGFFRDLKADRTLMISARTGAGLEELKEAVSQALRDRKIYLEKLFPYDQAGKIQAIRKYGSLFSEEYTEDGIAVTARVPSEIYHSLL